VDGAAGSSVVDGAAGAGVSLADELSVGVAAGADVADVADSLGSPVGADVGAAGCDVR
jgi:hypothetical protein